MSTVDMRRRAAQCRLLATKHADKARTSEQWMNIAEQWDRLADAYDAGKALKQRFIEIQRQSKAARIGSERRARKIGRAQGVASNL